MGTLDVLLKRTSKVYGDGESIVGLVVIDTGTKSEMSHQGLSIMVDGAIDFNISPRSVGAFDAFYNSVKPIQLLGMSAELVKPGKVPPGRTEVPFEVALKSKSASKKLYETYHGVYISIQYKIRAVLKKGMLSKDLERQLEFFIEYRPNSNPTPPIDGAKTKPIDFVITPETLQVAADEKRHQQAVPKFRVTGRVNVVDCLITEPLTGQLIVDNCEVPIKSIEIQLLRIELCGCAEGFAKEATEIQNIQIADGDICHGIAVPIHMVFPRLFTCPTIETPNFKIDFEVNVVIVFENSHMVMHPIPIRLRRL